MAVQDPTRPNPRFKHPVPFRTAALTLDGSILIGIDADGVLVGWNARTARLLYRTKVLRGSDPRQRLTCSPDGRFVAVSRRDHEPAPVLVFRAGSGNEVRRFDQGFSPSFSPDGEIMAATAGPRLRRWAMKSGAELPGLEESGEELKWTAYAPTGDRIAASHAGWSAVTVWNLSDRRRQPIVWERGAWSPATALTFSPDGGTLAVGSLWGISFQSITDRPPERWVGHEEYAQGPLRFWSDGRTMIALSQRRRLLCWNLKTGNWLHTWSAFNTSEGILEVSDSGDRVIWLDEDGLRVERIPTPLGSKKDGTRVVCAAFTAEGQALTGDSLGTFQIWDPATQREISRHQAPGDSPIRAIANQGRWAICGGDSESVRIRDIVAEKDVMTVRTKPLVTSIALSPDSKTLALGHADGALSLWSVADGREKNRIKIDMVGVTAICWSADGRSMAWGDCLGALVVAEGSEGREAARFAPRGTRAVRQLQFDREGRTVLATDAEGKCTVYDGTLGSEPRVIDAASIVRFREVVKDRRWLASGFQQSWWSSSADYSVDGRFAVTLNGEGAMIWEAPGER
jgi:WD40 repeat protein